MSNKFNVNINTIIHQPVRLKIMIFLMIEKKIIFPLLEKELNLTPGNLGAHIKILNKYKLVNVKKFFSNNKPITEISISEQGQYEVKNYIQRLKLLINS